METLLSRCDQPRQACAKADLRDEGGHRGGWAVSLFDKAGQACDEEWTPSPAVCATRRKVASSRRDRQTPPLTDRHQALLLTGGIWSLAVLLCLVPYVGMALRGGATAKVAAAIISTCFVGALISPSLDWVAKSVRGRSTSTRIIAMTLAVIFASLALAFYDYWSSPALEALFPGEASELPLANAAAVVFSGVIWPFATLAAFCSMIETGRLAVTPELELAAAR